MNELKVIKVAELRKKLAIIPGKLLLSILIVIGLNWDASISNAWTAAIIKSITNLIPTLAPTVNDIADTITTGTAGLGGSLSIENPDIWSRLINNPLPPLIELVVLYGIVSYIYFFIKLIGNWIVGLIAAAAILVLAYNLGSSLDENAKLIILGVMLFGGPILDLLNLLRYLSLKNDVLHYHEHEAEDAFGDGYDRGYEKGYRRGLRENDDYQYERISRKGRNSNRLDGRIDAGNRQTERIGGRKQKRHSLNMNQYERDYEEDYFNDYEEDYSEEYIEANHRSMDYEEDFEEDYDDLYDEEYDNYDNHHYSQQQNHQSSYQKGPRIVTPSRQSNQGFFGDCKDEAAIKRRYRDLCKVYHPDSGNGSVEIFQMITEEYNRLVK